MISSLLPDYIEASSLRGLQRKMLMTNNKVKGQATFFKIGNYIKNNKNVFYAWFYVQLDSELIEKVVSNG